MEKSKIVELLKPFYNPILNKALPLADLVDFALSLKDNDTLFFSLAEKIDANILYFSDEDLAYFDVDLEDPDCNTYDLALDFTDHCLMLLTVVSILLYQDKCFELDIEYLAYYLDYKHGYITLDYMNCEAKLYDLKYHTLNFIFELYNKA